MAASFLLLEKKNIPTSPWLKALRAVVKKPSATTREVLRFVAKWLYRQAGITLLNKPQTEAFLRPHQIAAHPENQLSLPEVAAPGNPAKRIFSATQAVADPVFVWRYRAASKHRARLLPYGGVVADGRALCTDAYIGDFYRNMLQRRRGHRHTATLLAPWSHHLDAYMWGGYYDFVIIVAAKLCRMKEALAAPVFDGALVAYPLFNTAYEQEYLALLGVRPEQVVDSRQANVTFDECVLGSVGHWFYPNAADIAALRRHVLPQLPPAPSERKRLYISRAGRRRISNEPELISLLEAHHFHIIADQPRSVAEQIAIYRGASFIMGPHGASFTNILWCQPGAHLFELFSADYAPNFFLYLAQLSGLSYSAYHFGATTTDDWAAGVADDMFVSIPEVAECLARLLAPTAA